MSDADSQEPLSLLSESSFVILGQGSLPSHINDEFNKNTDSDSFSKNKSPFNNYESTSLNISDKSQSKLWSGSNLSEEEIQRKLDELIKENSQLKETLNQNNLAVKSQLDTFIMWQQEVLKTHETHKQKFLETKDLILKLRAENEYLKKQLKDPSEISAAIGSDIYAQVNKKPVDIDKLNQEIDKYEKMCAVLNVKNENLDSENQKLREELKLAKNEILKLNKELEDVGRENIFLKQKNDNFKKSSFESLSYKSLPSSEARAQISNLFEQLELEKSKVLKLTKELEQTKINDSEAHCSKLSTSDKLNNYIDKLNNIHDSFDKQSQRYSSLSSWVSLAEQNIKKNNMSEDVIDDIIGEINQLKTHLNQEGTLFKEKQESLLELRKQFHKLLEDYKALQKKLILSKNNEPITKEDESSLVIKLEKELKSKQQECVELKQTVEKLSLECEEIALLRVQVDLYQSDFNEEQAARKELAEQNEQLQSRIIALEKQKFNNDNSVTSPLESPKRETTHTCPKCLSSFRDISGYEKHFMECIDTNFFY